MPQHLTWEQQHLAAIDRRIAEAEMRITRLTVAIARSAAAGGDTTAAKDLLHQTEQLRDRLCDDRRRLVRGSKTS